MKFFLLFMMIRILEFTDAMEDLSYSILEKTMPYGYAQGACTHFKRGGFLPTDGSNITAIVNTMHLKDVKSIWMGIKKEMLHNWLWVDGSTVNTRMVFYSGSHQWCAVIDSYHKGPVAHSCDVHANVCYMCNLTVCDHDRNAFPLCINNGHYMLAVGYLQKGSWFYARRQCQKSGGDLAKIDKEDKKKDIFNKIEKRSDQLRCKKYYIGLRLVQWVNLLPSGVKEPVNNSMWSDDEVFPNEYDCVELVTNGCNKACLKTKRCLSAQNKVLCIFNKKMVEDTAPVSQMECEEEKRKIAEKDRILAHKDMITGIAVAVPVLLLFILLIAGIWHCVKRKPRAKQKNQIIEECPLRKREADDST